MPIRLLNDHRWVHLLLLLLLFLLLVYRYHSFVTVHFAHLHFISEPDVGRLLYVVLLGAFVMASIFWQNPSPYLHNTSMLFVVLMLFPNMVLHIFMPTNPAIPAALTLFVVVLRTSFSMIPSGELIPPLNRKHSVLLLLILTALLMLPVVWHFRLQLPGRVLLSEPTDLYDVRTGIRHTIPTHVMYILGQLSKAVLPAMLLLGLIIKRYWITALAILFIGYLFFLTPHKSMLIALIPLLFFAFWKNHHRQMTWFLALLVGAFIIVIALSYFGIIMPESLLIRRSLFTQAHLTHLYFEFFDGNPVYLSHSFLGIFTEYPYASPPPFLLGEHYFDTPEMSCNTGLIGDGFMNFGYPGVVLYILIATAIFQFIDGLSLHPAFFGLTFMVVFHMQNAYLFTTMVSHGLLMLLLIMVFVLRKRKVT